MKDYSYYQYMKTRTGEKSEASTLAEFIKNDTMFPKQETEYQELSEYLEQNPYPAITLTTFDETYRDYQDWLNH